MAKSINSVKVIKLCQFAAATRKNIDYHRVIAHTATSIASKETSHQKKWCQQEHFIICSQFKRHQADG